MTRTPPHPNDKLEVTPGSILVQRRDDEDSVDAPPPPSHAITICYGSSQHRIKVPADSTFGDLKRAVAPETGLEPKCQRLFFRGLEKEDEEQLDMAGVKDKSKILLKEKPESKQRKLDEMKKTSEMSKAFEAIAKVRAEVDKLSERVNALGVSMVGGTQVADKEFDILAELLMTQLLKLDSIEAEGEAKIQRKAEVCRVQNFVDTLDNLKVKIYNPISSNGNSCL